MEKRLNLVDYDVVTLWCHTQLDRVSGFICNVSLVDATREWFLRFIPWWLEYRYEMTSFMRYQGMDYQFRSLVGSVCDIRCVLSYPLDRESQL